MSPSASKGPIGGHVVGFRAWTLALLCVLSPFCTRGAESLPARPSAYVTDHAGVLSAPLLRSLNQRLEQFERESSAQIVAVVFQKVPEGAALEDFTLKTFEAWKIGQKGKNNGAALFVFIQDRKLRIEVGYGLEGAIPDALAFQIIEDQITPRFRAGDYPGGIESGIDTLIRAARGEYQGTGRTSADRAPRKRPPPVVQLVVLGLILLVIIARTRNANRGTVFQRHGRMDRGMPWMLGGGGGGWSGGGGRSGGGGGFLGGGGRSGGGGASGSW